MKAMNTINKEYVSGMELVRYLPDNMILPDFRNKQIVTFKCVLTFRRHGYVPFDVACYYDTLNGRIEYALVDEKVDDLFYLPQLLNNMLKPDVVDSDMSEGELAFKTNYLASKRNAGDAGTDDRIIRSCKDTVAGWIGDARIAVGRFGGTTALDVPKPH